MTKTKTRQRPKPRELEARTLVHVTGGTEWKLGNKTWSDDWLAPTGVAP